MVDSRIVISFSYDERGHLVRDVSETDGVFGFGVAGVIDFRNIYVAEYDHRGNLTREVWRSVTRYEY